MKSTDGGLGRLRRRRSAPIALAALGLAGACAPQGGFGTGAEVDPQTLVGLTVSQAGALLGEPELRRQEAPAEVWQYRTDWCVLDLYLYREGGDRKVVYTEARHRSRGEVDPRRCVGQIAAEARGGRRSG